MKLVSSLQSPVPTHPLEQGSANYSLQPKSSPLPVLINKALWEHSTLLHVPTVPGGLHAITAELSEQPYDP